VARFSTLTAGTAAVAAAIVLVAALIGAASPARAGLEFPLSGYLWSGDTSGYYSYNGSGAAVALDQVGTGSYEVEFTDLTGLQNGSDTQITPFDSAALCQSQGEGFYAPNVYFVEVNCGTATGKPANTSFDVTVTRPVFPPQGTLAYALEYRDHYSGVLSGSYDFSSAGRTSTVRHAGRGRYVLTLGGGPKSGRHGTVKVTVGAAALGANCVTTGWHGSKKGQVIGVDCFSAVGTPQDTPFAVAYASGTNLLGLNGARNANALVSADGRVVTQYSSQPRARITATRTSQGSYRVHLIRTDETSSNGGDVQVSPVGTADVHCAVVEWGPGTWPYAYVSCFNRKHIPTSTAFALQFVVAP
jgi:hypothetical protein